MTTPDPIVQFIRARLDEDEQIARETAAWVREFGDAFGSGHGIVTGSPTVALHVARFDPARVLRGVQAKRRAVDGYETAYRAVQAAVNRHLSSGSQEHGDEVVRRLHIRDQYELAVHLLASEWSDHADYRKEWKP